MGATIEWATTEAVAAELGVTEYSVRKLCQKGELPSIKVGRQWRVDMGAVRDNRTAPRRIAEAELAAGCYRRAMESAVMMIDEGDIASARGVLEGAMQLIDDGD